jgi:hypothetical protein
MTTKLIPLLAVLALTTAAHAQLPETQWSLYESTCSGGAAEVEITCGSYGRFLVGTTQAPPCEPIVTSSEPIPGYPPHHTVHVFPIDAKRLKEITPRRAPTPQSFTTSKSGATKLAGGTGGASPAPLDRWIAVIDFDSAHGESTTWLAGRVAGPSVTAALAPLDEPALQPLGPVNDLHLLARLCELVEIVESGALPPPTTINMSFGRLKRDSDPTSTDCPVQSSACQVAQLVHRLKVRGSTFVAAAGNHGAELFPASLEEVTSAGMLDANAFVRGAAIRPAWETPPTADAWIPGNALCLRGWSAPAGSSYSSAMLAGWLVEALGHPDVLAGLPSGSMAPAWNATKGCWSLGQGGQSTPWCNGAITSIFLGLTGAVPTQCPTTFAEPTAEAPSYGRTITPSPLPSIDTYGDPTHPTPESDPCVPCTGVLVVGGTDDGELHLDLSHSGPLPDDITFDEVDLRVGDQFHPLDLTEEQLQLLRTGGLATLVVPDAGLLIPPGASLSLWYRMSGGGAPHCEEGTICFWSSTPLLLGNLQ